MSGGYGRAYEPGRLGDGRGRPRPLPDSSLRLDGGDTYPNKYLKSGSPLRQMGVRVHANRAATFTISLMFPILILLMLSITVRSEDSGGSFDWQLGVRVIGYSLAALSALLALGTRKMPIDRLIFAWALVPICIMLTSLYAHDSVFSFKIGRAHLVLLLFAWRLVTR